MQGVLPLNPNNPGNRPNNAGHGEQPPQAVMLVSLFAFSYFVGAAGGLAERAKHVTNPAVYIVAGIGLTRMFVLGGGDIQQIYGRLTQGQGAPMKAACVAIVAAGLLVGYGSVTIGQST